jgi:hypothetical protein
VAVGLTSLLASGQGKKDSAAAAATRKKLKTKITVDYKDTRLKDIASDIQKQLDNRISIRIDNEGGVSNNLTITFSAEEKPLDVILDEMFSKNQLGYVIVSSSKDRRDGWLIIKKGKQRGYEAGEEPGNEKTASKPDDKPTKDGDQPKKDKPRKEKAGTDKPDKDSRDKPEKDKAAKKDKAEKDKPGKDKAKKDGDEEDGDKTELQAARKLSLAKMLQKDGLIKKAKIRYREIIKDFPKTKAAEEARTILKKLDE